MKEVKKIFFFIVFMFLFVVVNPETITLVGTVGSKESLDGLLLEMIYTEVFRRLNIDFEYISAPGTRATTMVKTGKADGEIHRISFYGDDKPELIRVNESHFSIAFSAFSLNPDLKLSGWGSLKNKDYSVIYRRGVKICETKIPEIIHADNIYVSSKIYTGLRMLLAGRADLFIDSENVIESIIMDNKETFSIKIFNSGIMEEITTHVFLNIKHKSLAPEISTTLKKMKEEGLIEKYKKLCLVK